MAFDAYLQLGTVPGESADKQFGGTAGWIDVISFTYGVSQSGSASSQGGLSAGKSNFQDFTFTQKVHFGSPEMFLTCANGKVHKAAHFVCRKAGETPQVYLQIKMEQVMITSVTTQGAGGPDEIPTETVSMTAEKLAVWYGQQDENNKIKADKATGWDQKKNEQWNGHGLKKF